MTSTEYAVGMKAEGRHAPKTPPHEAVERLEAFLERATQCAGGIELTDARMRYSDLRTVLAHLRQVEEREAVMREALEPFAAIWREKSRPYGYPPVTPEISDADHAWGLNRTDLYWGDFRRAAALTHSPSTPGTENAGE